MYFTERDIDLHVYCISTKVVFVYEVVFVLSLHRKRIPGSFLTGIEFFEIYAPLDEGLKCKISAFYGKYFISGPRSVLKSS
jgi:hypothetical protein